MAQRNEAPEGNFHPLPGRKDFAFQEENVRE
jgi:hypothetical protein